VLEIVWPTRSHALIASTLPMDLVADTERPK
jgi:hypothetical protein